MARRVPYPNTGAIPIRLIEFHLVHHCNLTCAHCSHFSPIAPPQSVDERTFENDVALAAGRLDPRWVHLLGGEPLLHPRVPALLAIARRWFSDSEIKLVTNGVLFPRLAAQVVPAMREHRIILSVSVYPQVRTDRALIERICAEEGLSCEWWEQSTFVDFLDPHGASDPREAKLHCPMELAANVRDGRLYPCPITAWGHFSGLRATPSDGVPLTAPADELRRLLDPHVPTSLCRFCRVDPPRVQHRLASRRRYPRFTPLGQPAGPSDLPSPADAG